ncbi:MAG: hypothetical protein U1E59_12595 [Amaricoccus sp.]
MSVPVQVDAPVSGGVRVLGAVDLLRPDRVGGWAIDRSDRAGVLEVDVFREGRKVGTVRADRPRKDLPAADGTASNHGFAFALEPPLEPGFEFTVSAVARAADGAAAELRRAGGDAATPERRLLERVFEELVRLRREPAPVGHADAMERVELAQARIEAALAVMERPLPAPPAGLRVIAIVALAIGSLSLALGIVSMFAS